MIDAPAAVRRAIVQNVRSSIGGGPEDLVEYDSPAGDPGLFGPDSPVWVVHGDLPSMLIGGFAALMTQTLHPLAMAGVAGHSNYREDPTGRLRRTARFIAATTFGARPFADRVVAEVHAVHERVRGTAPDGRAYSASDPALLTFVHVTEVSSFLAGYQRYGSRPLLAVEKDRYLDEVAIVAELLGAVDVPRSVAALRRYERQILPALARGEQAIEALAFLSRSNSTSPADVVAHRVIIAAAEDLLPERIRTIMGLGPRHPGGRVLARVGAMTLATTVRWAIGPSVVRSAAMARIGAD